MSIQKKESIPKDQLLNLFELIEARLAGQKTNRLFLAVSQ